MSFPNAVLLRGRERLTGPEEFIGVISYADLRKAFRQIHHVAGPHGDREMAEVSELFAIGAGSLWRSIGDLIGNDRQR